MRYIGLMQSGQFRSGDFSQNHHSFYVKIAERYYVDRNIIFGYT